MWISISAANAPKILFLIGRRTNKARRIRWIKSVHFLAIAPQCAGLVWRITLDWMEVLFALAALLFLWQIGIENSRLQSKICQGVA